MNLFRLHFRNTKKYQLRIRHLFSSLVAFCFAFFSFCIISCKQGPKEDTLNLEPLHDVNQVHQNIQLDVHRVKVLEILPAKKYLYLKVEEGEKQYWLATGKSDIVPGKSYEYNEALIRNNFRSEELDREFDELYLVTRLIPAQDGNALGKSDLSEALKNPDAKIEDLSVIPEDPDALPRVEITTLLKENAAFEGQWITVQGTCIKVNNGIMGRNWVHLAHEDGKSEVVITTREVVEVGEHVGFAARVALNRDFGSGYSYPLLLEQGVLIKSQ